jgi:hypothetical protein
MDAMSPPSSPRRVGPVDPDLLQSAIFLYGEYLEGLSTEAVSDDEEDEVELRIDTRAVLDLFAEELATGVTVTLNLFMRVTALQLLLTSNPAIGRLAREDDGSGALRQNALVAAARLDLYVRRNGDDGRAEFDSQEFRDALDTLEDE